MSILQKITLIVRARSNAALDEKMGVPELTQLIQDEKAKVDDIGNERAAADGHVTTLEQDIARLENAISVTQDNIDLLLGDDDTSNDSQAAVLEQQNIGRRQQIEAAKVELIDSAGVVASIDAAIQVAVSRIQEAEGTISTLANAERVAATKEKANETLARVSSMSGNSPEISFGALEKKIQERANTADSKLKSRMASATIAPQQSVLAAQASAAIEKRKAELAAKKAGTGTQAAAA